jgi:hypothetical protein
MLGKTGKERVTRSYALALQLAHDRKFRDRLVSAIEHGSAAGRRARHGMGLTGTVVRLAADESLLKELRSLREDLEQAYEHVEATRRTHKLRNVLLVAGLASLFGLPQVRARIAAAIAKVWQVLGSRTPGDLGPAAPAMDSPARPHRLEDLTKEDLYERAREADIPGRSEMTKEQLVAALRAKG